MTFATAWNRLRDGLLGRQHDERDVAVAAELATLKAVEVVHSYRKSELRRTMRENVHIFESDITDTLELLGGYPRKKPPPDDNGPK